MKVLVVVRAGGRIQSKKTVTASWLRVGRNASCEVHLADPRVALEQGLITHPDEGFLYVEGETAGGQNTTRKAVRSLRLKPGEAIEVGPYRVELQPGPAGYDGAIQVEPEDAKEMARRSAREEGLLVGISSGATLAAIKQKIAELPAGSRVLGFNYDTGERYLSVPDFLPTE